MQVREQLRPVALLLLLLLVVVSAALLARLLAPGVAAIASGGRRRQLRANKASVEAKQHVIVVRWCMRACP